MMVSPSPCRGVVKIDHIISDSKGVHRLVGRGPSNCLREWDFLVVVFNFQGRARAHTNSSFRTFQWEQLWAPLLLLGLILNSLFGFAEAGKPFGRCPEAQEIGQNGGRVFCPLRFSVSKVQLFFLSDLNYWFWIIKIQSKFNIRLVLGSYFLNRLIWWLNLMGCQTIVVWGQSIHRFQLMKR